MRKKLNESTANFVTQEGFDLWAINGDTIRKIYGYGEDELSETKLVYRLEDIRSQYDLPDDYDEDDIERIIRNLLDDNGWYYVNEYDYTIDNDELIITNLVYNIDKDGHLYDYAYEDATHYIDNHMNKVLYFDIKVDSGHYDGLQTIVTPSIEEAIEAYVYSKLGWAWDDEEEANVRVEAEQAIKDEINTINKEILPGLKNLGWHKLSVEGVFSNGEAIYRVEEGFECARPTEDYLKKVQKKHKKTIKKGAMGAFEHIGGDPKKNAEIFNHMMDSPVSSETTAQDATTSVDGGVAESIKKENT